MIDSYISEWILGWFGGVTILLLTCVIVWISYIPGSERSSKNKVLENIFGSGEIQTQSGVSSSPLYPRIERLSFDRKNDALSFISMSGSQVVSFPENISYESLPYDTLTIGDTLYTIMADGGVVASGAILGQAILRQDFGSTILYHTG